MLLGREATPPETRTGSRQTLVSCKRICESGTRNRTNSAHWSRTKVETTSGLTEQSTDSCTCWMKQLCGRTYKTFRKQRCLYSHTRPTNRYLLSPSHCERFLKTSNLKCEFIMSINLISINLTDAACYRLRCTLLRLPSSNWHICRAGLSHKFRPPPAFAKTASSRIKWRQITIVVLSRIIFITYKILRTGNVFVVHDLGPNLIHANIEQSSCQPSQPGKNASGSEWVLRCT